MWHLETLFSSSFLHMNQRSLPFNISTSTQKTTIVLWFMIMSWLVHGCFHNFHSLPPTLALFGSEENWTPNLPMWPNRSSKIIKGKGCQNHNRNRRHLVMAYNELLQLFLRDFWVLTVWLCLLINVVPK